MCIEQLRIGQNRDHERRNNAVVSVLLTVAFVSFVASQPAETSPKERRAEAPLWTETRVPGDKAMVEFLLPAGSQLQLDGKTVAQQPVEIGPLPKDAVEAKTFRVHLPDGRTFERQVLLQAGWHVEVPAMIPPAEVSPPAPAGGRPGKPQQNPPPKADSKSPEVVLQRGHNGGVTAVAFSSDGQLALTGGSDDSVILWETATGRQLRSFPGPAKIGAWHPVSMADAAGKQLMAAVVGLAFVNGDREFLMAGAAGGVMRVNRTTGQELASYWPPQSKDAKARGGPLSYGAISITPAGSHILWDLCRYVAVAPSTVQFDRYGFSRDRSAKSTQVSGAMNARPLCGVVSENGAAILLSRSENLRQWTAWDGTTGQQTAKLAIKDAETQVAALTADGKLAALACWDAIHLYEMPSGQERGTMAYPKEIANPQNFNVSVKVLVFSADGKQLAAGSQRGLDGNVVIWNVAEAKVLHVMPLTKVTGIRRDETPVPWISLAFSPDGKKLISGTISSQPIVWDTTTGKRVFRLGDEAETAHLSGGTSPLLVSGTRVDAVAIRPDGRQIAAVYADGTLLLWNGLTSVQAIALQPVGLRAENMANVSARNVVYSPDSRYLVTTNNHGGSQSFDARTGQPAKLQILENADPMVHVKLGVVFHLDGRRVFVGNQGGWNGFIDFEPRLLKGYPHAQIHFTGHPIGVLPGGHQLLCRVRGALAIWDIGNGNLVWPAHLKLGRGPFVGALDAPKKEEPPIDPNLPADARTVLEDSQRNGPFDAEKGAKVNLDQRVLQRLTAVRDVTASAFRGDGRMFVTGGADGLIRMWDAATGDELARLYAVSRNGDWAVVTPAGLFDGSRLGRETVTFRTGAAGEVVPLDHFFQMGYYPGLLPTLLRGERPMPQNLTPISPAPIVKALANPPSKESDRKDVVLLDITVTDEGGGIKPPTIRHNHAMVRLAADGKSEGKTTRFQVPVNLVAGDNRIDVRSATADGRLESKPALLNIKFDGQPVKPDLYVIAVGLNRYDPAWQQVTEVPPLTYAVADAKAMVASLRKYAGPLFGEMHVLELYDDQASRAGIRDAIQKARRARPEDVFLLYVAGHGKTVGDRYYLIPYDAKGGGEIAAAPSSPGRVVTGVRGLESAGDKGIRASGLAVDELAEALADIPALKRVFIFDTCSSGSAATLASRRQNPFAVRGTMERAQHSQGVYCLTAAPAGVAAKEPSELGGGVLTYALLAALGSVERGPLKNRPPLRGDRLGVLEWFQFANKEVPALYESLAGIEQPVVMSGAEQPDFPLFVSSLGR
jgi:WD40 repeat protein